MSHFSSLTINNAYPGPLALAWVTGLAIENGWVLTDALSSELLTSITGTYQNAATASATSTTITRSGGTNWTSSALVNKEVIITSGTGVGQSRVISANTSSMLTVAVPWDVVPDTTTVFGIYDGKSINVLKSPEALNGVTDFYVCIGTTSGSASIYFGLFEQWDSQTKLARKYAPKTGAAMTVDPADNTVVDVVGQPLTGTTNVRFKGPSSLPVSNAVVFADITAERIVFASTSIPTAESVTYVGLYDSLLPPSMDPVPLVIWNCTGDSTSSGQSVAHGSCTREPGAPAVGTYNFCVQIFNSTGGFSSSYMRAYPSAAGGGIPATDVYRGSGSIAPMTFETSRASSGRGGLRGSLKGVYHAFIGAAIGDTLTVTTVGGQVRTYVLVQYQNTTASNNARVWMRTS